MFLMINYCNILSSNILIIRTCIIAQYCRTEYCNILIYRYIVSALVHMYVPTSHNPVTHNGYYMQNQDKNCLYKKEINNRFTGFCRTPYISTVFTSCLVSQYHMHATMSALLQFFHMLQVCVVNSICVVFVAAA